MLFLAMQIVDQILQVKNDFVTVDGYTPFNAQFSRQLRPFPDIRMLLLGHIPWKMAYLLLPILFGASSNRQGVSEDIIEMGKMRGIVEKQYKPTTSNRNIATDEFQGMLLAVIDGTDYRQDCRLHELLPTLLMQRRRGNIPT